MKTTPWMKRYGHAWISDWDDGEFSLCHRPLARFFDLKGAKKVRLVANRAPSKYAYKYVESLGYRERFKLSSGRLTGIEFYGTMSAWIRKVGRKYPYFSLEIEEESR